VRRNRAALRDYYGLRNQNQESITSPTEQSRSSSADPSQREADLSNGSSSRLDPLDREAFDAGSHVRQLLESEPLSSLLALENELVSDVRALDGERKALVYDNYSKLIAATDTIKKMRSNMDPLSPATSTLSPAISHIAETAAALADELAVQDTSARAASTNNLAQAQKVKWVLATPDRLQSMFVAGQHQQAIEQLAHVKEILVQWKSPPGTDALLRSCETVVKQHTHSEASDDDT